MTYLDEKISKMDLLGNSVFSYKTNKKWKKTPPHLVVSVVRHEMGDKWRIF